MSTQIDLATTHAKTQWLKDFVYEFFPQLEAAQISIEDFAILVEQLLIERGLYDLKQQKNPRSNIVCALKSIDLNHPAIPLVALTADQYRDLNEAQQHKLASRETRYIPNPEALVATATALLDSAEWSDIAAGLAILIGRRVGEILLSKFSLNSEWTIDFSEMSKKAFEHQIIIEIPTLAPAAVVLNAIDRLKHTLNIDDLKRECLNPAAAKKRVSDRYSQPVSQKCDRHYQHLIPPRSNRETLYTHVFRAAYVAISIHWYCPPHIPEHHYRAEILGHYTIGGNGNKLPDYKAGNNYADYVVGDGNRDGRLGIKLGTIADLQVIAAFNPDRAKNTILTIPTSLKHTDLIDSPAPSPATEIMTSQSPTKLPTKRPELSIADIDRMVEFWSRLGVDGGISHLFHETIEHLWSVVPSKGTAPLEDATTTDAKTSPLEEHQSVIDDAGDDIRWLVDEVKNLRANEKNFTRSIADLHTVIANLKGNLLDRILPTVNDRSRSIAEVEQSLEDRESIIAKQEQSISNLQHIISQLQADLASTYEDNQRLVSELAQMKSKFDAIASVFGGTPSIVPPVPLVTQDIPQEHSAASSPHSEPAINNPIDAGKPLTDGRTARYTRSLQQIDRVVSAMIDWNDKQDRPDRRLLISYFGLKPILRLLGATSQAATQEVLSRRSQELLAHHSKFALGQRHNASIDLPAVLKSIAQHELKLDNWNDIKL